MTNRISAPRSGMGWGERIVTWACALGVAFAVGYWAGHTNAPVDAASAETTHVVQYRQAGAEVVRTASPATITQTQHDTVTETATATAVATVTETETTAHVERSTETLKPAPATITTTVTETAPPAERVPRQLASGDCLTVALERVERCDFATWVVTQRIDMETAPPDTWCEEAGLHPAIVTGHTINCLTPIWVVQRDTPELLVEG